MLEQGIEGRGEPGPEAEETAITGRRLLVAVWIAGGVLFSVLFFKNAWLDEDAYITFRSVEQLFAGNGLRWNPHARVQAFTHPLWLGVLAILRIFFSDPFPAAILASYLCCLAALATLARLLGDWRRWLMLLGLLVVSKSFFDFTSSGLENALAYALLSGYALCFLRLTTPGHTPAARDLGVATALFALLLLTRHDLLTLVLPAQLLLIWQTRHLGLRPVAYSLLVGLSPFLLWTAFSLFYYGFPFPNTAYAKLNTGIPDSVLVTQGLHYLQSLLRDDPLTLFVILSAMILSCIRAHVPSIAIGAGLLLNMIYVVKVGGDYMSGRFLASAYLLACIHLVERNWLTGRAWPVVAAVLVTYAIWLPGSPITTGANYRTERPNEFGVGDQRGILFHVSSLGQWLNRDPEKPFPDYHWSHQGAAFAASPDRVLVRANVGFLGYWSGTDKIVIDRLALTDPLLARLPVFSIWRIGHFPREIPAGYPESVESGESLIEDPQLRALHERLRLVTEGPLFSFERLKMILAMNLGFVHPPR